MSKTVPKMSQIVATKCCKKKSPNVATNVAEKCLKMLQEMLQQILKQETNITFRLVSFRLISFRSTSFRFVLFHFVSFRFVSSHFVSFDLVSFCLTIVLPIFGQFVWPNVGQFFDHFLLHFVGQLWTKFLATLLANCLASFWNLKFGNTNLKLAGWTKPAL